MRFKLKSLCLAVAVALGGHLERRGLVLGGVSVEVTKEEHAKLPKDVQALYVEKDGKYRLDGIEPPEDTKGLKSALEKERENRKTAEAAVKELAKTWEGLDAAEIRRILEKLGGDEEAQLIKAGKIDEVVTKRMAKAQQAHERALVDAGKKTEAANARAEKFSQRVLDNHIRAAAVKAGLHANAVDDALFRARTLFRLDEDGNAVQLGEDGKPVLGKDGKTPFAPEEWLGSMKETAPHWFPAGNAGGGAAGNKGGQSGKQMKRAEFDKLTPEARTQTVRDKVAIVD